MTGDGTHPQNFPKPTTGSSPGDARESCSLGFAELFTLAKGRPWSEAERSEFYAMSQIEKNEWVQLRAEEAGSVETQDRRGTDGLIYKAFWRRA